MRNCTELLFLKGGIISLDGEHIVKVINSGTIEQERAKELGKQGAFEVLDEGGAAIFKEIRQEIN